MSQSERSRRHKSIDYSKIMRINDKELDKQNNEEKKMKKTKSRQRSLSKHRLRSRSRSRRRHKSSHFSQSHHSDHKSSSQHRHPARTRDRHAISDSNEDEGKYKTQICSYWKDGSCPWGNRCRFAHGYNELRSLHRYSHLNKKQNQNQNQNQTLTQITVNNNNVNTNNNNTTASNTFGLQQELELLTAENKYLKLQLQHFKTKWNESLNNT